MEQYTIAIIGRTNAGKSTLFNRLCKKNRAIVAKQAGVTRDYQQESVYWKEYAFTIIDTSGFEPNHQDLLRRSIDAHFDRLLDKVDAYLFLCDGQTHITQLDEALLEKIRKKNKPYLGIVNKIDTTVFKEHESEFYEFFGDAFEKISAERGTGIQNLLKRVEKTFPLTKGEQLPSPHTTRVVIMGRPNVGKSTLMNRLLSEERVIVSPIPGTTRDPVDSVLELDGQTYIFIDTAGLRKKRRISEKIEILSTHKSIAQLDRANLLLLLIDALQEVTDQDVKIAGLAWDRGVGVILLINKWDLLAQEKKSNTYWQRLLARRFRTFHKIPFLFISATEGKNTSKIFDVIRMSGSMYEQVLNNSALQTAFESWTAQTPPPRIKLSRHRSAQIRFYGCRQVDHAPPVFRIQTNHPDKIPAVYDHFLKNQLRETFGFWGIPINIRYSRIN